MNRKSLSLDELSSAIGSCTRCERAETRNLAVPGEWGPDTRVMLLGEAPGKQEDRMGRPFEGRAGRYLTQLMDEYGLRREQFFITSVLKCFHPGNPKKSQLSACMSWTEQQIREANTRAILVMGTTAASALLGMQNLGSGATVRMWNGVPCVVTAHPAAAMRFPDRDDQFRQGWSEFLNRAREKNLLP